MRFRVVSRSAVPLNTKRNNNGITAAILAAVIDSKPKAVEVPTRSNGTGRGMCRRLVILAKEEGYEIGWSRSEDSQFFYFWIEK